MPSAQKRRVAGVSDGQGKERAVIFPAIQGGFRDIQPIKVIQRESVGQHTF